MPAMHHGTSGCGLIRHSNRAIATTLSHRPMISGKRAVRFGYFAPWALIVACGARVEPGPSIDSKDAATPDGRDVCVDQGARSSGSCDAFLGWAWDGAKCIPINCKCVGACADLAGELALCEERHSRCK
jgi:hypothetical protein